MKLIAVIPARYASTRFPGKPLIDLKGKSMIQRVYESVVNAGVFDQVIVATDDSRIESHVKSWNGNLVMTSPSHVSGTDRCAEVITDLKEGMVVNIQGDEPLIDAQLLKDVVNQLKQGSKIVSAYRTITKDQASDENVVKVVCSSTRKAMYFSRSKIPFERNQSTVSYKQHIGVYGFDVETLKKLTKLPVSPLETMESLEQLRWLENDYSMDMVETNYTSIAIDVPEDVPKVLALL